MKVYLDILKLVLENGKEKYPVRQNPNTKQWEPVSEGIKTLACPNIHFSHNMEDGFPLLTTKKMAFKSMCVELEGFIKGITNKRWYKERGCHIWDDWCNPEQIPQEIIYIDKNEQEIRANIIGDKAKDWQKNNPDLGCIYGYVWRNFDGNYTPIPFPYSELDKTEDVYIDKNDSFVGKQFCHNKYGKYIVKHMEGKNKYNKKTYTIKFYNTNGENYGITKIEIYKNEVKDVYYPFVSNVGCFGHPNKNLVETKKQYISLYNTWHGMIDRCYNIKNKRYHIYGKEGVYVDNRWLIFANFLQDISKLPNWKYKLENWDKFSLDKDLCNQKRYGPDTCLWLDMNYQSSTTRKQRYFKAISPDDIMYYGENIREFARNFDLNPNHIGQCIRNKRHTHKGWKFIQINQTKKYDQLSDIIYKLKNNPLDRRMVCMAWNPTKLHQQSLPPCHIGFIITVIDNKINLHFTQRSADLPLGVPFNISSYGLLLELLAKESGFKAGNLSGIFVDCHIYENQIESVKEQLSRVPTELPQLTIPDTDTPFSIFEWTYKDVLLENYNPQPKIKFGDIAI